MKKAFIGRTLWSYLRDRRWVMLYALLCVGLFTLLCALFGLPLSGALYAAVLCLSIGLLFAAVDFSRYVFKHAELSRLRESALIAAGTLPEPAGRIEADYRALLEKALEDNAREAAEAEREQRTRSDYYSLWAHQIKVPISAMKLLLQADQSKNAARLGGELFKVEQYVEMALTYVRLNGSATDYVLKTYALDAVIRQAARKFAPLFIQKKLALEYSGTSMKVLTDEKWLVFVIEQLLSNAVKYTRRGSVTIRTDEARQSLMIEDTGIGIAPEDLPRVFEQGYTGYNGRGDKRATGLGLYLCKQVLTRLGHGIAITSEEGRGTRVELALGQIEMRVE